MKDEIKKKVGGAVGVRYPKADQKQVWTANWSQRAWKQIGDWLLAAPRLDTDQLPYGGLVSCGVDRA